MVFHPDLWGEVIGNKNKLVCFYFDVPPHVSLKQYLDPFKIKLAPLNRGPYGVFNRGESCSPRLPCGIHSLFLWGSSGRWYGVNPVRFVFLCVLLGPP